MATFDEILNIIIPWLIVIVFGFIFYLALKEPLDKLFDVFYRLFSWIKMQISGEGHEDQISVGNKSISFE